MKEEIDNHRGEKGGVIAALRRETEFCPGNRSDNERKLT